MRTKEQTKRYGLKYREIHKEQIRRESQRYYNEHRGEIRKKSSERYLKNKEIYKERVKKYCEKNVDKVKERQKRWYLENKEEYLKRCRGYYFNNKGKIKMRTKKYRSINRDHYRTYVKKYRLAHPDRVALNDRRQTLKKYGLTLESFSELVLSQSNRCKICGQEFAGTKGQRSPAVDHCHKTGKVRGILCSRCNITLGGFNDSLELMEKAIQYLKENI